MKNVSERKTVLLAERDIQPIVSSRGLQLEIERAAKTLAQRQPPGFVDARAKWGVDDQLHAAALVEKAFGDDGGLRGNSAEHRASSDDVFDGLLGAGLIEAALEFEPIQGRGDIRRYLCFGIWRNARDVGAEFLAPAGDVRGELLGARWSFTTPEGNVGRCSLRVFYEDPPSLHAPDAPGSVSQQHDVARDALDGKIFIYSADHRPFRVGDHGVQRILGNCAAAGDGGQAAAAAGADHAVHAVAMEVRGVTPARAGDAFGEHFDNFVKIRMRQIALRVGA